MVDNIDKLDNSPRQETCRLLGRYMTTNGMKTKSMQNCATVRQERKTKDIGTSARKTESHDVPAMIYINSSEGN